MMGIRASAGPWSIVRASRGLRAPVSRRRARRAWAVEVLEGRALLSVYLVDSLGDAGVGTGFAGDLRYAIDQADQATGNSTIAFSPTLYGQTITLDSGMLVIDKPSGTLTIHGPGAGLLSISGGRLFQVLDVTASSRATISGLTITGGAWSLGAGGGIVNDGQLTLDSCTITGNTDFGGGGGGIANGPDGTMTIEDSTISANVANVSSGGGIDNAGAMTIVRSTVSGNGSRGGDGGGIINTGTLSIGDSTISGNRATIYNGGGIFNSAALTLTDDTISDNTASIDGGGIVNQAIQGGTTSMANTIVADNLSLIDGRTGDVYDNGDTEQSAFTGSYNLIGTGEVGVLAQSLVGVDPQLGPLQANGGPTWTQAIQPGSPAAGAGNPALVPAGVTTDQRGVPYSRIVQGRLDIGAFEIQAPPQTIGVPPLPPPGRVPVGEVLIGLTFVPASQPDGTSPSATRTAVVTVGVSPAGE